MSSPSPNPERYVIEREVGRGTSGVVYSARDLSTQQRVALKLLYPAASGDPVRQLREAELIAKITHPAIVCILDQGVSESGCAYIAMEWLEGEDLSQRQRRAPLAMVPALRLIVRVADALAAAHDQGVVHLDIKPANVFLMQPSATTTLNGGTHDPLPKVLDFGAAIHVGSADTREGSIIGTPAYMSPEQVRGDQTVAERSDVYSLGATLYELLAGHPPHQGPSYLATLARLATTRARRLLELKPETPPALDELVHQMLATEPEERPENMREVARSLAEIIERVTRGSIADIEPSSYRLGSSASRLLTTLVASRFADQNQRDRALGHVQARGTEAVPLGRDSLVAHFGARRALGNEAESALRIGRRLTDAGAAIGVATGRAFVPMVDLGKPVQAIGEVVDRATSLSRTAKNGQLLVDVTTRELGRESFEFTPRGREFAEVGRPLHRSRLPAETRTPFVGRDVELGRVTTAYERALERPGAVVVSISGSPGIGKTRLQREVIERLSVHLPPQRRLEQRSEPYGMRRALGVALDVLRRAIGLQKLGDEAAARLAIERTVEAGLDEQLRSRLPLFVKLLSQQQVPAEEDTRGLRDLVWLFMTQAIEHCLTQGPIVIVCEDLQWADPESVQWLDHLLGRATELPLLLLVTARREFWSENPDRFAGRDHVPIDLHPISNEGTRRIIFNAGGGKLAPEAVESLVQQAGGSPLFAEELARLALVGANVAEAPTIEAAIQVSLDALSDEQREALRRFSVLGQAGWDEALAVLGVVDAETPLRELEEIGVLVPHEPSRFVGLPEWQFKHGLVRDVVYQSLGVETRQHLHGLAARWLEAMHEDPTVIARHYDLSPTPERGADFWARAAQQALGTNALSDALTMAERALGFADTKDLAFERARLLDEAWSRLDARASDRETAVCALEGNAHDEPSRVYASGARALRRRSRPGARRRSTLGPSARRGASARVGRRGGALYRRARGALRVRRRLRHRRAGGLAAAAFVGQEDAARRGGGRLADARDRAPESR